MNQQRARRFKSVKEAMEAKELKDILMEQWAKQTGIEFPQENTVNWDRNQITPGDRKSVV